jgi:ATPase subunit of ABC transporter with duplicated ATPase domains
MSNVNWTILPKERWALVGRNGAGKSTLLRAITGTGGEMVAIREGEVCIAKKARMGYLEQKGVSGSTRSVREEVASRMDRLTAATKALEDAEKAVSNGDTSDEALTALSDAAVEFEAAGGYTVEQKIANVLKGLGFVEEDYDRKCSEFSGGWQMRIALARLLLSEPDLLLLDEPTNHLDKGARDWLGDYLSRYTHRLFDRILSELSCVSWMTPLVLFRYDGTLLLVSHDTTLLKAAVSSIAEVRGGTVELYKSRTHDQWLIERDERVKAAQAAFEANQREIARLQTFVDRFGAKTMGASLAQSKLKTIEKLEAAAPEAPKTGDDPLPVLKLPNPPRGSQRLMELKGCTLGWPASRNDPDAPAPTVLSGVNLVVERGMRIAVRGPNGAGMH